MLHPKVDSDLGKLPSKVVDTFHERVDALSRGERHASTHPLNGPLRGWHGTTIGGRQYRMVHKHEDGNLMVLSAGAHDASYDQALRRNASDDYHMSHRPGAPDEDGTSAPAHALDKVFPKDVYTHPHYYGSGDVGVPGGGRALHETAHTLRSIRGKPDADVTMYRSLPPEHAHKGFGTGDWVSAHPTYAQNHGLHHTDEKHDWPVIKATVKAKHLWNNGDSLDEFGYHGPPVKGELHHPGGSESAKIVHQHNKIAARFSPKLRVFTHTCGLDHRLWDEHERLKSDARQYVMKSMNYMWSQKYRNWQGWARVYFAGSEASEWTSEALEGNGDFDVLVGVDYDKFRQANESYIPWSNEEITAEMNTGFRVYNGEVKIEIDGVLTGPWDRTTYVNKDSYDIRNIKPYAAYDVGNDEWVVKPPHLPHWGLDKMPKATQKVLRACDTLARDVLKLPEPERTQQGAALFDFWHTDRSRAFGPMGFGWYDIANLREKWLDQAGLWSELVDAKHRFDAGLGAAPADWSNTPKVAVKIEDYQHDPERNWFHGSQRKFKEFKKIPSQSSDWNTQLGTHFTSEPDIAKIFGRHVHQVKLEMHNPKVYPSEAHMDHEVMRKEWQMGNTYAAHPRKQEMPGVRGTEGEGWKAEHALRSGDFEAAKPHAHSWISAHPDRKGIADRFVSQHRSQGHDGIVYGNDVEGPGHASAIAFDPSQIKMRHNE